MSEKSNYEKLAAIDVSAHIEKKNNLSYLSWAWAVDQLMRADSTANWVYNEPMRFPDETMMVSCTVTAFNKPMTMHLPVMDYKNKAIPNPNAFAVNTAMMRCLVKAIALHGLGLYIYAGEDLPLSEEAEPDKEKRTLLPTLTCEEAEKYYNAWLAEKLEFTDENGVEDADQIAAAWGAKPSNVRTAIKKFGKGEFEEQQHEVSQEAKSHLNSI